MNGSNPSKAWSNTGWLAAAAALVAMAFTLQKCSDSAARVARPGPRGANAMPAGDTPPAPRLENTARTDSPAIAPASEPATAPAPAPAPVLTAEQVIAKGGKVFQQKKCNLCHNTTGMMPGQGPNLSKVGGRLSDEQMRIWIREPKKLKPATLMPTWEGSDEQFEQLIAFLVSLK